MVLLSISFAAQNISEEARTRERQAKSRELQEFRELAVFKRCKATKAVDN
jgi:hypothetical protein